MSPAVNDSANGSPTYGGVFAFGDPANSGVIAFVDSANGGILTDGNFCR